MSVHDEVEGAAVVEEAPAVAAEVVVADSLNVNVPSVPATIQPVTRLLSLALSLEYAAVGVVGLVVVGLVEGVCAPTASGASATAVNNVQAVVLVISSTLL